MKKILLIVMMLPCVAFSNPYFRPLDPSHLQIGVGSLFDTNSTKATIGVMDLAIITHSNQDGSIIPKSWQSIIPAESWVPLQIGGGGTGGNYIANIGSSYNLIPVVQNWTLKGLQAVSSTSSLIGLKNALTPAPGAVLGLAAGPSFAWQFVQNGDMEPMNKWKGFYKWYTGGSWKF